MPLTGVQICSNALIRLGASAIQSFEGSDTATTCDSIYTMKKAYMLAGYPWRFTKKFIQLSRISVAPTAQWAYQFQLPADRVTSGLPVVYESDLVQAIPARGYTIVGNVLMSNLSELWIEYQAYVDESLWEPYFTELMIHVMMDELCFYITDNAKLSELTHIKTYGMPSDNGVGGVNGHAMNLDSRDNPTTMVLDSPLLEARFSSGNF
jgi:hypothetical protein